MVTQLATRHPVQAVPFGASERRSRPCGGGRPVPCWYHLGRGKNGRGGRGGGGGREHQHQHDRPDTHGPSMRPPSADGNGGSRSVQRGHSSEETEAGFDAFPTELLPSDPAPSETEPAALVRSWRLMTAAAATTSTMNARTGFLCWLLTYAPAHLLVRPDLG